MAVEQVRIGLLGAARIAPAALLSPARAVPGALVTAIAARDPRRAQAFAARHGIPRVHQSYAELIADPALDAVYVPLPNSLHCAWTMRAIEAGKHVLCEKPFAANAAEAQRMAAAAAQSGLVVMEAFHYRYHPLAQRMLEIVAGGALGRVRHIEAWMCIPLPLFRDIRYRYDLAGGATMDVGAYTIHLLRTLAADEPTVTRAEARLASPTVDRWMRAEFSFAGGCSGRMTCALFSSTLLRIEARVQGERGELRVVNFAAPQRYHRLTLRTDGGLRVEQLSRRPSYEYQLRAFVDAILHGAAVLTPPADAVANMRIVDAVYEKAGLPPRGTPMV